MLGRSSWIIGLFALSTLTAAPALTTVEDRLYKADGSKFTGVLFIEWKSFETADNINVPSAITTARVVDGLVRVALAPTTTAEPPAYYRVHYNSNGRTDFVEYWAVPVSTSPVRIRDVRIPGPLSVSQLPVPPINTAILIPDVSGLRDELDSRPVKGAGYSSGRVAVVNSEGAIESALGSASDCVHVDGSSGLCGGGNGVAFIDAETPTGGVDGANATFTLAAVPEPITSLKLYRNGILQRRNVDYTISGAAITMDASPGLGDVLAAYYRRIDETAGPSAFVDDETPAGAVDGANSTFNLITAPMPASSLQLYRNGLLMKLGLDYDLTDNAVAFREGAIPQAGDVLCATYRY